MLRDNKTSTNQRNDSDGKRGRAHFSHAWCDRLQVSAQVFGKWQHQDGCESEARGGEPIVARVITWRKQARDHPVTPIVIVWEHPRTQAQGSEERQKNEGQQQNEIRTSKENRGKKERNTQ